MSVTSATTCVVQYYPAVLLMLSDCSPRMPNLAIPAIFANPESWDWWCPNPGISWLQKFFFDCEM